MRTSHVECDVKGCYHLSVQSIRLVKKSYFEYFCEEHSIYPELEEIYEEFQWHGTQDKWVQARR